MSAFIRRFSSGGSPDDTVPRELYAIEQDVNDIRLPRVRVAASRSHYIAVWATSDGGNWSRESIPFEGVAAISGQDFPNDGSSLQWTGTIIRP